MKIRNGFVSNSSTSSFLMLFDKTEENHEEVNLILGQLRKMEEESNPPSFCFNVEYVFCGITQGKENDYKDGYVKHFYKMYVVFMGEAYNSSDFRDRVNVELKKLASCSNLVAVDDFEI